MDDVLSMVRGDECEALHHLCADNPWYRQYYSGRSLLRAAGMSFPQPPSVPSWPHHAPASPHRRLPRILCGHGSFQHARWRRTLHRRWLCPCLRPIPHPASSRMTSSHVLPFLSFSCLQVMGHECINFQMPMLPATLIDMASRVCPF